MIIKSIEKLKLYVALSIINDMLPVHMILLIWLLGLIVAYITQVITYYMILYLVRFYTNNFYTNQELIESVAFFYVPDPLHELPCLLKKSRVALKE